MENNSNKNQTTTKSRSSQVCVDNECPNQSPFISREFGSLEYMYMAPSGGGTLIFSYIRRLGSFMGVQNFEFQYFFGVFRKMNYFRGKILWIFFLGSSQNWTIFRGPFHAF